MKEIKEWTEKSYHNLAVFYTAIFGFIFVPLCLPSLFELLPASYIIAAYVISLLLTPIVSKKFLK